MTIKLSSSDRALLSFKEIEFDRNKDYSRAEANLLLDSVVNAADSYSQSKTIFEEELLLKYEEVAEKIRSQIDCSNFI